MTTVLKPLFALCFLLGMYNCQGNTKVNTTNLIAINETIDPKPKKQTIKVALLLDTSNSMDGLIDQAKAQLWQIVNELSYAKCDGDKPSLEIALYEYGNDNLTSEEGYIRQVLAFSNDLDDISKELFSLTTNGGNEYCGFVINSSINQLSWGTNEKDLKLIFIAGNEPFTQGSISYKEASNLAKDKDITVNTIFCGDYNLGISTYWKDGADLTKGNYMAINHNKATTYVSTPFDQQILDLNTKLNGTYVSYGAKGRSKLAEQAVQDTNASGYSSANAVNRTVSKSSHLYKNSGWDLVDAVEEAVVELDEVKEEDLPEELKGKSEKEIKSYIEKKQKERQAINQKIQDLNNKRREFVANHQKNNKDENLENVMIKAIKTQAKTKNYSWN